MLNDPEVLHAAADITKRSAEFGDAMDRVSEVCEKFEMFLISQPRPFEFAYSIPGMATQLRLRKSSGWKLEIEWQMIDEDGEFSSISKPLMKSTIDDKLLVAPHFRAFLLAYREKQALYIAVAEKIVPAQPQGEN